MSIKFISEALFYFRLIGRSPATRWSEAESRCGTARYDEGKLIGRSPATRWSEAESRCGTARYDEGKLIGRSPATRWSEAESEWARQAYWGTSATFYVLYYSKRREPYEKENTSLPPEQ